MRAFVLIPSILTVLFAALLISPAQAQPSLEALERRLQQEPEATLEATIPAAEPGYLGVRADDEGEEGRGIRVINVFLDGPAGAAGMRAGDLVVSIDGQPVRSMEDMINQLKPRLPNDQVTFEVIRGDATRSVVVTLGKRPPPPIDGPAPTFGPQPVSQGPLLGADVQEVTPDLQLRLNLPDQRGAFVREVLVGSPAEAAGLPVAAVILGFNEQAIATPDELIALIRAAGPGAEVNLHYVFDGQPQTCRVLLAHPGSPEAIPMPGRGSVAIPSGAASPVAVDASSGQPSLAALERRIAELEQRILDLEAALRTANSPAP